MKRVCFVCLCCALCLCLCACSDMPLEKQIPVVSMGVDKTDKGYSITVKTPKNKAQQSGGGGDEKQAYLVVSADGADFAQAVNALHVSLPRNVNFSQVREVVFGEKMARAGDFAAIALLAADLPDMRLLATPMMCNGEASEFLKKQEPELGARLSKYIEGTLQNAIEKGNIPPVTLGQLTRDLGLGWSDPPLVCVSADAKPPEEFPAQPMDMPVDDTPQKGVSVVLAGAALTDGVSVCHTLSGYEVHLLGMLLGKARDCVINTEKGYITYDKWLPTRLSAPQKDGRFTLKAEVFVRARGAPQADQAYAEEALRSELEKLLKTMQRVKSDVAGFANQAVRGCLTLSDWEKLDWRTKYAEADTDITVHVLLMSGQ